MTNETNTVLGAIENVKKNVQDNVKTVKDTVANLGQFKGQVKAMVKEAQGEFAKLVNKDLATAKKKFAAEKILLEKEVKKQTLIAKKFIDAQKKEIASLQAKLEKIVAMKKKAPAKKATKKVAKKATAKKATKKVASK